MTISTVSEGFNCICDNLPGVAMRSTASLAAIISCIAIFVAPLAVFLRFSSSSREHSKIVTFYTLGSLVIPSVATGLSIWAVKKCDKGSISNVCDGLLKMSVAVVQLLFGGEAA